MIQRASDTYLMRLTHKVEEGGAWHLHHRGIDPPTVRDMAEKGFAVEVTLIPVVNDGRWIVVCPHCQSGQLASPTWSRFLCVDCANVAFGGNWLPVEWPAPDLVTAGEAALDARPDPGTRHWNPTSETVGALLAENVIHGGLYDSVSGAVGGDIGQDQGAYMIPEGDSPLSLPRGD